MVWTMYTLSYASEIRPWASTFLAFYFFYIMDPPPISFLFHEAGSHIQDWPQICYDFELLLF